MMTKKKPTGWDNKTIAGGERLKVHGYGAFTPERYVPKPAMPEIPEASFVMSAEYAAFWAEGIRGSMQFGGEEIDEPWAHEARERRDRLLKVLESGVDILMTPRSEAW